MSEPATACSVEVIAADLSMLTHRQALVGLLNAYAQDPMGGGLPLTDEVQRHLPDALARRVGAHVLLAQQGEQFVGLLIAMEGFSTFACKPLLNIHDIVVLPAFRQRGIAGRLLARTELIARQLGCCKLTLEVLENNLGAQASYRKAGFAPYQLDPQAGRALFWQKPLELQP